MIIGQTVRRANGRELGWYGLDVWPVDVDNILAESEEYIRYVVIRWYRD